MRCFLCVFSCLLFIFQSDINGQSADENWELGLSVGLANYQGDVVASRLFTMKENNLALGIHVRKLLPNERFAIRANAYYSNLSGDDNNFEERQDWSEDVKAKFESSILEFTAIAEYYPFARLIEREKADEYGSSHYKRMQPFVFLGLGAVLTDPEVIGLTPDAPEFISNHYSKTHISIPMGAGFRWDLNDKLGFNFEAGWRWPISDYIDGISDSRDPDNADWYVIGHLGMFFKLDD